MAGQTDYSASKAKQGVLKPVLTSDSSSSDERSTEVRGHAKELLATPGKAPTKRGAPPPPPSESILGSLYVPERPSSLPKGSPLKVPPPPLDALGSLYVPADAGKNVPKEPPPKPERASADPLLSVDSTPPSLQRIKSAVLVRAPGTEAAKERHSPSASMESRTDEYQPLSRSASKTGTSKPGAPAVARMPAESAPTKPKGKSAALEEERRSAPPAAQSKAHGGKPYTPKRRSAGTQEAVTKILQESSTDDAWTTTPRRDGDAKAQRSTSKDRFSRRQSPLNMVGRRASLASVVSAGKSRGFSKQMPQLPSGRSGQGHEDVNVWADMISESSRPQKPPHKLPSSGTESHSPGSTRPPADQGLLRDLEGRLAGANKRVAELENQLQEAIRRHRQELEHERSQLQSSLQEEISKTKSERDEALQRVRREAYEKIALKAKEEQARMEEFKKQALARQNSMKMQCDASVRELKEQVESLEKKLKARSDDFEKERTVLMKSFEDRRKNDLEALEKEEQAHLKELKNKEAELLEQQGRIQALTTSVQTLTTSLAQMKELNDVSRTATQALEEKTKTQAAYINTLMKREESVRAQVAKLMPIKEAKRLAFRALLKGRAVEMISRACMPTDTILWNKAWAFQQFVYLIGGARGSKEKRQDAIESRLMQFRKEQMFLMAENERLMAKVRTNAGCFWEYATWVQMCGALGLLRFLSCSSRRLLSCNKRE